MKNVKFPELAAEMARRGDTQKDVAKLLEITNCAVWRRMAVKTEWKIGEIDKICKHYDKDYYELFKRESE